MLQIAVEGQPEFVIDERELSRGGTSYMVDTLASLRREYHDRPLCLLLGLDAFVELDKWYRWEELIGLAHLAVMSRPAITRGPALAVAELLEQRRVEEPAALHNEPAGRIIECSVTQLEISATDIRELVARGGSPRYLLPDPVLKYIGDEELYES